MFALMGNADGVLQELEAGGDPYYIPNGYKKSAYAHIWDEWDAAEQKPMAGTPMLAALIKNEIGEDADIDAIQTLIRLHETTRLFLTM